MNRGNIFNNSLSHHDATNNPITNPHKILSIKRKVAKENFKEYKNHCDMATNSNFIQYKENFKRPRKEFENEVIDLTSDTEDEGNQLSQHSTTIYNKIVNKIERLIIVHRIMKLTD